MYRRATITLIAAAATGLAAVAAFAAAPGAPAPVLLQEEDTEPVIAVEHLVLGSRYVTDIFELEIQDVLIEASPHRHGYSEVRATAALRILGGVPVPYEWAALTGILGYPELQIVDAEGEVWDITITEPGNSLLPGSNLVSIEPFVPVRWTIGFEVPTAHLDDLTITASRGGQVIADWDVYADPQPLRGWEAPLQADVVAANNPVVPWGDDLDMTIIDFGTTACDASNDGNVTTGFAMQVEVESSATRDSLFPNVLAPEPTAIAVWDDGASARMTSIDVTGFVGSELEPINARTPEQLIVPPGAPIQGFVSFLLPRDTRFADPLGPPHAVIFYPPGNPPQWFEVTGAGTLPFADDACDGIAGGPAFQVGIDD